MSSEAPTSPNLLERATQGDQAALSALICLHKERVYHFAVALRGRGSALESGEQDLDAELTSDVTASMEELADVCARSSGLICLTTRARVAYDSSLPGRVNLAERAREAGRSPAVLARQTLMRRWHVVHALCRAAARLLPEQRALLVLVDMEGLECDQVAWLLGITECEARERLLAARAELRVRLFMGADGRTSQSERESA
jgi:DNA-directed RNA polymerase specialized sigma24 family protein